MIEYLEGSLKEKRPTSCLIEVNGIGYKINIPLSTFAKLGNPDCQIKLLTSLYIREDSWELYGFYTAKEKEFFNLLNSISGIGPRLALTLLSSLSVEAVIQIVNEENISELIRIPGIGKKIAERLVFELRNRSKDLCSISGESDIEKIDGPGSLLEKDAIQALISLGYKRMPAEKAIKDLRKKSIDNLESLIREALKKI